MPIPISTNMSIANMPMPINIQYHKSSGVTSNYLVKILHIPYKSVTIFEFDLHLSVLKC